MENKSLIEIFESSLSQDVSTFNAIFKKTPIKGFSLDKEVEIKELQKGDERRIIVGNDVILLKIVQENSRRKVPRKKKIDLGILKKVSSSSPTGWYSKLPEIFKKLSPSEFMVYQAISMLECVDGIEELSKQMSLNYRTIRNSIKTLSELGVIRTERVSAEGKPILRLHLTQQSLNGNVFLH